MRALEEKLKADFMDEKDQLIHSHETQVEQLKTRIKAEREKATEEERDFIRVRYQKQYEQDVEEVRPNVTSPKKCAINYYLVSKN